MEPIDLAGEKIGRLNAEISRLTTALAVGERPLATVTEERDKLLSVLEGANATAKRRGATLAALAAENPAVAAALGEIDGLRKCPDCLGTGIEWSSVCHCGEMMDGSHDNHSPVEMTRRCESCTADLRQQLATATAERDRAKEELAQACDKLAEFVWGENNPKTYETLHGKLAASESLAADLRGALEKARQSHSGWAKRTGSIDSQTFKILETAHARTPQQSLAALTAKIRREALEEVSVKLRELLASIDGCEINPSNYSDCAVSQLNDAYVMAFQGIESIISTPAAEGAGEHGR